MSELKVVVVADLHGELPEIPPCDLLLIAGDICPDIDHSCGFQEAWLETSFKWWLRKTELEVKKIVFVAGNHDFIFQDRKSAAYRVLKELPATYLEDDHCYYNDLKIYGTPWQLYHGGWAFNLYEPDLKIKWDKIPEDTDILVCHSPPVGYGDKAPRTITDENETSWPEPEHVGSPSLLERIKVIQPKLVVFGHIHSGFGQWQLNDTILVNAAQAGHPPRLPVIINLTVNDEK